jgi:ribosome modulation factor
MSETLERRSMKLIRIAAPALALALLGTTGAIAQYGRPPQGPPPPGYGQGPGGGWDTPPREYREFQRRGFQDGIEGARKDIENHRRPNVNNRDEFRNPSVPRNVRRDYRDAFRRGYDLGIQHAGGRGGAHRY